MNKQEALELAKQYSGKSTHVHVAEDGNVFFQPQRNYALNHSKKQKIELFSFTDAELKSESSEEVKLDGETRSFEDYTKSELIALCIEKGFEESEYKELKKKAELLEYIQSKI